ncbi:MAG TPA: ABC transporter substrate-binding protein [Methylomirabilota bacterium]|jgi:branched-chain amino acid transport system substrate-binding protein|nr:ABC transporter substrate-binding protein [Methylomirabilota bacterium]
MRSRLARALVVLVLAAFALSLLSPAPAPAQSGPIKIGFLAPLTGPFAQIGKDMVGGTELYLDEIGRTVGGRKIEIIIEDTEGQPSTALNKSRKLVEQDKVHILTGGLLANVGYALQPFIDGQKIPTTYPVIAADDITQRKPAKWIVRTGWATSQPMHPFADWVLKNTKHRKIVTIGMDYAFGYETVGGFQRVFEEGGGQIVQKIWAPLNTNDFAPFLAQVRRDADAVLALFVGRLALQFVKQYEESGLKARLPLLGGGTTTDESVLPQMGDEAIGVITALHYSQAIDTPANQKFARAFEAKAGKIASYYSEATYTNARWITEAIKLAAGRVEDRDALLAALRRVNLKESPRGPLSVDSFGNPVQNIYVRRVEKVNGRLQNTVIATYPAVSQFWKYNPEEYLKQPLYSRDYPPCKHCQ